MGKNVKSSNQHRPLLRGFKNALAVSAVATLLAAAGLSPVAAGGESRTISLYHIHTGESLTVTYMKDGHYVPSAMKQINYLLRDWRLNKTTNIDPRSIDLVWELHEDLGSHEPVHVVCGYRSAQTNAFLHRIGRHVARESQHIQGKAIDFYFPDVPTVKIRNTALVRQIGGVGFYRSAGGPTGFLHVDSGHVRHWGPYIAPSQMAQIFRDGQRVVGRRLHMNHDNAAPDTAVASADSGRAPAGFLSKLLGLNKNRATAPAAPVLAEVASADLADLTADAATQPIKLAAKPAPAVATSVSQAQMASLGDLTLDAADAPAKPKPAPVVASQFALADVQPDLSDAIVKLGRVVPKPRLKPVDIMLVAAANMKPAPQMIRINAASAPPPSQSGRDLPSPVADSLGTLMEVAAQDDATPQKAVHKTSLAAELRNGTAKGVPVIKPMIASVSPSDVDWWPKLFLRDDAAVRRDGQPPLIGTLDQDSLPRAAVIASAGNGSSAMAADLPEAQHAADGKGDLAINEDEKGDLSAIN